MSADRGIFARHRGLALALLLAQAGAAAQDLEEIVVWGDAGRASPVPVNPRSVLTPRDFAAINAASTEDLVKFEPSLVIRRRFIGDANGTLGMRGASMFQTARSMVFADGVPLHYLLQSRWSGAPRWTLVSASEIAQVEVLYGPFSAEYSGNAMGGVVLIESAIPQGREFHFDSSAFLQDFSAYGFDDSLSGYKTFLSYGDKHGDLSFYLSWNRLENDSQPQSFYYGAPAESGELPVSGGLAGPDERGVQRLWFGDSGVIANLSDNFKLKLGVERERWSALLNLAYEDRAADSLWTQAYLRDAAGDAVWAGTVVQEGQAFTLPAARLGLSLMQRDSLNLGLRLRAELSDSLALESNFNRFDVLRDENRASLAHPAAPGYDGAGQLTAYDNTGWSSAELKLRWMPRATGAAFVAGLRRDDYALGIAVRDTLDWRQGEAGAYRSRSGGETGMEAAFLQAELPLAEHWQLTLGWREEIFTSRAGYFSPDDAATPAFELVQLPGTRERQSSPKLSLAFLPDSDWSLRWSLARAVRFPIVEELFSQYQAWNAVNEANPDLRPERGLHQDLMLERIWGASGEGGSLRLNLYQETIEDVIEAQTLLLPGGASLRTFIPLDEVRTRGLELAANFHGLLDGRLDLRVNAAWTLARIEKNAADRALEGRLYPRLPKWRANLLATWHVRPGWDLALNHQYAADSFGLLDNSDRQHQVYGAQDGYARTGLKSSWRLPNGVGLGIGVDNLENDIAYVAHPWPGRSWYLNLSYEL